jgi:hypothetical protein
MFNFYFLINNSDLNSQTNCELHEATDQYRGILVFDLMLLGVRFDSKRRPIYPCIGRRITINVKIVSNKPMEAITQIIFHLFNCILTN